ncbi:MAG TPA: YegP family protein [Flavobacterium sp.]|nr:YegP family protein [Flavobacterium sp.]
MITWFTENLVLFTFTKVRNAAGKYFFRLSKDGLVLANSRKYSTELLMIKGIDEITKYVSTAEILDFSENDFVFPDAEMDMGNANVGNAL